MHHVSGVCCVKTRCLAAAKEFEVVGDTFCGGVGLHSHSSRL
jgi:hypothetical protein